MGIDDADAHEGLQRFRERVKKRAAEHGLLAGVAAGEQFRLLDEL